MAKIPWSFGHRIVLGGGSGRDGLPLYGDLNQSGDELEVIGAAPFQILLGKASARRFVSMGKWSISSRIRPENLRQDSR